MQLARIYHGHTTGILTVVSKNPLPFFSFRFSSIFFFYCGNGSCLSILCFCLVVVDCKSKNKQTNKQTEKNPEEIWILSVLQDTILISDMQHAFRPFSFCKTEDEKEKKCVTTLFYIIQIRSHGLSKENDWNRFKFARNPAGDEWTVSAVYWIGLNKAKKLKARHYISQNTVRCPRSLIKAFSYSRIVFLVPTLSITISTLKYGVTLWEIKIRCWKKYLSALPFSLFVRRREKSYWSWRSYSSFSLISLSFSLCHSDDDLATYNYIVPRDHWSRKRNTECVSKLCSAFIWYCPDV